MNTSLRLIRNVRRSALFACLAALGCAQLQAQPLHRCRVDGRLVVQAAPCPLETQPTAAAPQAALVADGEAPKKRTLADVMREREAENRARPAARETQIDGAKILRDRMGAL